MLLKAPVLQVITFFLFIGIGLFGSNQLSAQKPKLVPALQEIDEALSKTNDPHERRALFLRAFRIKKRSSEEALYFGRRALLLIDSLENDIDFELRVLRNNSIPLINRHFYEEAESALLLSQDLAVKAKNDTFLCLAYIHMGWLKIQQFQHSEALYYHHLGLDLATRIGDFRNRNNALNRLGGMNMSMGKIEEGIAYWEELLAGCNSLAPPCPFRGSAYLNLITAYNRLERTEMAENYLNKWIEVSSPLSDMNRFKYHRRKALISRTKGNMEEVKYHLGRSIEIGDSTFRVPFRTMHIRIEKYSVDREHFPGEEEIADIDQVLQEASKWDWKIPLKNANRLKGEYFERKGSTGSALNHFKSALEISEDLIDQQLKSAANNEEAFIKLIENQQHLQELKIDQAVSAEKLKTKQRESFLYLLGILGVTMLAALLYYFLRSRTQLLNQIKEKNNLIEDNLEEKQIFLRELNHRVKNNYQFIASMLDDLANGANQEGVSTMKQNISSMAVVHQQLLSKRIGHEVGAKEFIPKYIQEVCSGFSSVPLNLEYQIEDITLTEHQAMMLSFVLNEVLTNVYKHEVIPESTRRIFHFRKLEEQKLRMKLNWERSEVVHTTEASNLKSVHHGSDILNQLLQRMGGEYSFNINQSECSIMATL